MNDKSLMEVLLNNKPSLIELIESLLIDPAQAEDVYQDLSEKVYTEQFVYENRGKPLNFLKTMARNRVKDYNRHQKVHNKVFTTKETLHADLYFKEVGSPARQLINEEFLKILEGFGDDLRQIFELRDRGYTVREIADILGKTKGVIYRKIHKIRDILRKLEEEN